MKEKLSIRMAIDTFHFDEYDIVVKLTGKYFIPYLVCKLEYVPKGTDLIIQANVNTLNQNCECFGATVAAMSTIINRINDGDAFEIVIYESLSKAEFRAIRLPAYEIPEQERVKRADNSVLTYL